MPRAPIASEAIEKLNVHRLLAVIVFGARRRRWLRVSEWIDRAAVAAPGVPGATLDRGAPAPRDANGRPDLSGVWQAESMPLEEALKVYPGGVNGAQTIGEDVPDGTW